MTTFSDLMTLLLTFFILLYSMSTIDVFKFENVASALQSVLIGEAKPTIFSDDIPPGNVPINDLLPIEQTQIEEMNTELVQLYQLVNEYVKREGLQAEISVRADRRGVIIDIKEKVLFDSGAAVLKGNSKEVLDKVVMLIEQFDNKIIVEGHTDTVPINTAKFPSNWELSVIRAINVLRYFTEEKDIDPVRISVAGYGKYKPISTNDNTLGRAMNRRVNILILVETE